LGDRDHHYTHIIQNVWDNTHEGIASKKVETIQQLEKNNITISSRKPLMDDQFVWLSISHLLTLKDNYVLVEMSYINAPIQLYYIRFTSGRLHTSISTSERYLFYHNFQ
jgi:hypothetical protein